MSQLCTCDQNNFLARRAYPSFIYRDDVDTRDVVGLDFTEVSKETDLTRL